jgi:hypothetical protein
MTSALEPDADTLTLRWTCTDGKLKRATRVPRDDVTVSPVHRVCCPFPSVTVNVGFDGDVSNTAVVPASPARSSAAVNAQ